MNQTETVLTEIARLSSGAGLPCSHAQLNGLTAAFFGYPSWEALNADRDRLDVGLPGASAIWVRPSMVEKAIPPAWRDVVSGSDVITECSDALRTALPNDTLLLVSDDLAAYAPELIETALIPDVMDMLDGALKEAGLDWPEVRLNSGPLRDEGTMLAVTVSGAAVGHRGPEGTQTGVIFDVALWFGKVAGQFGFTGPDVQVMNVRVVSDSAARTRCPRASDAEGPTSSGYLH